MLNTMEILDTITQQAATGSTHGSVYEPAVLRDVLARVRDWAEAHDALEEERKLGDHIPCQQCNWCYIKGWWADSRDQIHNYTCPCDDLPTNL